jgi:hypothetical protein
MTNRLELILLKNMIGYMLGISYQVGVDGMNAPS